MIGGEEFAALVGPEFRRWLRQMERLGGCASPVYLIGRTLIRDRTTGELLHVFSSLSQPYGRYAVGCRNRRESVCLPCSYLHHGDTYQLVVAGLAGGKGVPAGVVSHPRVFVTLTAPSFGAVHRVTDSETLTDLCRARRDAQVCAHGVPEACYNRHGSEDERVGVPLCMDCYDYLGAVLWNASVGKLWHRFTDQVKREMAKRGGVRVRDLGAHVRVSFAKVVEYQRRGSVHLHAVIRCDGPGGPGDPAPDWASPLRLAEVVTAAVTAVRVTVPEPGIRGTRSGASDAVIGGRVLSFGREFDVQEIRAGGGSDGLSDQMVAAYVAKYVTKGDVAGLVLPNRLRSRGQIDATPGLSAHGRRLMHTAWALGEMPQYAELKLTLWAHQAGFRGHILTKSRAYSTTYTALRAARSAFHRPSDFDPETTEEVSEWQFDHVGHTPGQAALAAGIARGMQDARNARKGRMRADRGRGAERATGSESHGPPDSP